jgi:hypothetical protein
VSVGENWIENECIRKHVRCRCDLMRSVVIILWRLEQRPMHQLEHRDLRGTAGGRMWKWGSFLSSRTIDSGLKDRGIRSDEAGIVSTVGEHPRMLIGSGSVLSRATLPL